MSTPALDSCLYLVSHGLLAMSTMNAGCAESDIIWSLELWEGKDRPTQLNNKPFDDLGKPVGTLLHLKEPVWGSGRVFVLDSGFCVLQAIVEL